jgi:hypothetical protein
MDRRSSVAIKVDALVRMAMWRSLSGVFPLYLVPEYPKSGGTWLSLMIADYLQVPFPRNRLPRFGTSVMHGHYLHRPSFRNVFCLARDGRDVMASAYFHQLFRNDRNHPRLVEETRRGVPFDDYDDVRKNMPRFIEYMFEKHDRKRFRFTWSEFVRSWTGAGAHIIRYEELLGGAADRLGRALNAVLGIEPDMARLREIEEKYSFKSLTKRQPGEENRRSFLRKGIAGDWKEKFSPEAREVFHRYAGRELILMGYEKDDSWVASGGSAAGKTSLETEPSGVRPETEEAIGDAR